MHHWVREVWQAHHKGVWGWRRHSWGGGRVRDTFVPTKRSSRFLVDPLLLLVTQRSLRLSSTGLYTFASPLVKILVISFAVHHVQNLLSVFPVSCSSCDLLLFCSQYEGYVLCSQKIGGVSFVLPGWNHLMCDKSREAGSTEWRSDGGNIPLQVELRKKGVCLCIGWTGRIWVLNQNPKVLLSSLGKYRRICTPRIWGRHFI